MKKMERLGEKVGFYLIVILLVIFPLGQLSRIPLPWPEVRVYGQDIIIIAAWLHCFIVTLLKRKKPKIPQLIRPILLFAFVGLVSLGVNASRFSGDEVVIGGLYLARWLAYPIIYWAVLNLKPAWLSRLTDYLVFAGMATVVFGLIQYVLYPSALPLTADQWDPHVGRIIGTFLDPGFTGLIYVFTLLILIPKLWAMVAEKKTKKSTIIHYSLFIILTYLALLLTYSRASYGALLVGVGVVSLLKHSGKFFLGFLLLFLVSLPLLPRPHGEGTKLERQSTIQARLQNWLESFEVAKDYPILGTGFNLYRYEQRERGWLGEKWQVTHAGAGADSSFLFALATTGVIGLSALAWMAVRIWRMGWQKRQKTWGLTLVSSLAAVGVHAWFNNALFYPWIMVWLWILVGLAEAKSLFEKPLSR